VDERWAIARLKRGDIGGLEMLVRAHQQRATGAAYLIVRDWGLAEDLVQSAFIRAYERIDQFDDTRPFGPWFLRIVSNDATKAATRSHRHLPLDPPSSDDEGDAGNLLDHLADSVPGPVELLEQVESRVEVWEAMERLSPMQREAVVLRYYLELTETQVADRLGVAPGTAKWHLHHARKRLEGLLAGLRPDRAAREADTINPDAVPQPKGDDRR
jgi:RNA polymerase sigma-70 factor (ECF subfamily)